MKTCRRKLSLIDHLHESAVRVAALTVRLDLAPEEYNSLQEEILAVQTEWKAISEELRWHRTDHGC